MRLASVSTCNLNQWALDFDGNLSRIRAAISKARASHSRYLVFPELATTGYGCEDHLHELDTEVHSWQLLAELIRDTDTIDIILDVGAPVLHRGVLYNCRVLLLNQRVLLVRPKVDLAGHGNYREGRWFGAWGERRAVEEFVVPDVAAAPAGGPYTCPIGFAAVQFQDGVTLGCETCEELWTPRSPNIGLGLEGVDVMGNGSGSHHVLRKLGERVRLLEGATRKGGGVYLYSNQIGCDGGRLYYDGSALIAINGDILKQGSQFTVATEIEVVTAVVDIDEEEIARGPACWLWDYLRRSGLNGFFLPLSGGADSSSTVAIVGSMCQMLVTAANAHGVEKRLLTDIRRVTGAPSDYVPSDARELAGRLLHTVYMGCEPASSAETRKRASKLAAEVGAWHADVDIASVVDALLGIFETVFRERGRPKFCAHGGGTRENIALQCVQARVRMVLAYLFAQLALWGRGRLGGLLVLGSANVDEGLRGYLTKYDCSSADLNPIGGISKADLKEFLRWAGGADGLGYQSLGSVIQAAPTAELEPIGDGYVQTDEEDMGMTYEELRWFGRLRKLGRCGPVSMYERLVHIWRKKFGAAEVASKVKFFFRMYGINRHKMTVLTPSYHAEDYSPDDNRFDLRQFLYRTGWHWQFRKIDVDVQQREDS